MYVATYSLNMHTLGRYMKSHNPQKYWHATVISNKSLQDWLRSWKIHLKNVTKNDCIFSLIATTSYSLQQKSKLDI